MNKKILILLLFFTGLTLCIGCNGSESAKKEKKLYAMDTYMELTAYGSNAETGIEKAENEIKRLEKIFSVTDENSEISMINNNAGNYTDISQDTTDIISSSLNISKKASGTFDISVYPIVRAWGFTTDEYKVPSDNEIKNLLSNVGYENIEIAQKKIKIKQGMAIDLGGIAKGYTSQKIIQIIKESGISSAMVSLGGNIQLLGTKPGGEKWKIAIADPFSENSYACSLREENTAIVTSGSYQRCFVKDGITYHHIIDPATGYPAENDLKSVTIVCDSGTDADGLSTALFVMGKEKALDFWRENGNFEAIIITDDKKIYVTDGLESCFETEDNNYQYEFVYNK